MNNKIAFSSNFIFVSLFLIMAFSLQSCLSPRGRSIKKWERHEWKIVKSDQSDKPNWSIYTRKIVDTDFIEYKIEGIVEASPDVCISSFKQDLHKLANEKKNKKYPTYEIVNETKDSLLTYVIHKEPFPLKNTEMSVRYTFFNNENGSRGVKWHEAWNEIQVKSSKKLSRVETFRGSWNFSPSDNNSSKALNTVRFNPKKMPRWLFEPMVFKFLKTGLEDIRNMTSK